MEAQKNGTVKKLDMQYINQILELSKGPGFPFAISEAYLENYCANPSEVVPFIQGYGIFVDEKMIGIGTLSVYKRFPHKHCPTGTIADISGVYVLPEFRRRGYASILLNKIIQDAEACHADYIALDAMTNIKGLYEKAGFISAPSDETRMWCPHVPDHS